MSLCVKNTTRIVAIAVVSVMLALPASAEIDASAAATLTQLTAVAASKVEGTEVLSSRDIQEIVALESDKQLIGCADESSCLAEVAGALGARFVVFSQLGELDDTLVLTLNLFDADEAKSVGRKVVDGSTVSELGEKVGPAVVALIGDAIADAPPAVDGALVKVLVMDIRIAGQAPSEQAPGEQANSSSAGDDELPFLLAGGGGLLAGAGLLAIIGVAFGSFAWSEQLAAADAKTPQTEVLAHVGTRDVFANLATTAYVLAGATALAGGALIGVSFLQEGE